MDIRKNSHRNIFAIGVVLAIVTMMLCGCGSGKKDNATAGGALVGAGVGAGVGAVAGDAKGAAIGGVTGGILGALIGRGMSSDDECKCKTKKCIKKCKCKKGKRCRR